MQNNTIKAHCFDPTLLFYDFMLVARKHKQKSAIVCVFQNGRVNCQMKWCPQQCAHPVSMRDCCPVCDGCLYEGQRYGNTQTFYAPSDPCNRCVCQSGSVTCSPVTCPPVSCSNPIIPPGQCCPQCRGQCVCLHTYNMNIRTYCTTQCTIWH